MTAGSDRSVPLGALVLRHVEARHVSAGGIGNRLPDALHQPGPLKDLFRESERRPVMAGQEGEALPGVLGRNARKEMQIIVDDRLRDGAARHVDHARAGKPQQEQIAKHPLLVVVSA